MRMMMSAALIAAGALLGWSGGAVAAADSPCTSLGGELQDEQTCHVHTSTASYTLNMTFPTDYPDQSLTDFLTQNRDGFVSVAQTSSQTSGPRDVPYQMEVTSEQYRSGQPPASTRSVVLKVFEDLGGPRPSTFYKSFNWDVAGQKARPDGLFRTLVRQRGVHSDSPVRKASGAFVSAAGSHQLGFDS